MFTTRNYVFFKKNPRGNLRDRLFWALKSHQNVIHSPVKIAFCSFSLIIPTELSEFVALNPFKRPFELLLRRSAKQRFRDAQECIKVAIF